MATIKTLQDAADFINIKYTTHWQMINLNYTGYLSDLPAWMQTKSNIIKLIKEYHANIETSYFNDRLVSVTLDYDIALVMAITFKYDVEQVIMEFSGVLNKEDYDKLITTTKLILDS